MPLTNLVELLGDVTVLFVHEGKRIARVAHAASSPNAMNVIINVGRKVIVDYLTENTQNKTAAR